MAIQRRCSSWSSWPLKRAERCVPSAAAPPGREPRQRLGRPPPATAGPRHTRQTTSRYRPRHSSWPFKLRLNRHTLSLLRCRRFGQKTRRSSQRRLSDGEMHCTRWRRRKQPRAARSRPPWLPRLQAQSQCRTSTQVTLRTLMCLSEPLRMSGTDTGALARSTTKNAGKSGELPKKPWRVGYSSATPEQRLVLLLLQQLQGHRRVGRRRRRSLRSSCETSWRSSSRSGQSTAWPSSDAWSRRRR